MPSDSSSSPVLILGAGYTGRRVAQLLASCDMETVVTTRSSGQLQIPWVTSVAFEASTATDLSFIPVGARILYSIPALDGTQDPSPVLIGNLAQRQPTRVVYISTTGVYGEHEKVNEHTATAPRRPQDYARIAAEDATLSGPWSGIVLRPAAIYGPDRGIHVSMHEGRFQMGGDGSNYVSRIHADDLAAICFAALFADDVTGAWPVADDEPCTTRQIAKFCSSVLRVPLPPSTDPATLHHTRQANRQVDGSAIRRALGITLKYPTYREGIRAAIS